MSSSTGPLQGITILDLSRLLPGPLATQLMADMGAEVIKVEDAKSPDQTRLYPPMVGQQSIYFASLNRNKKSLGLDLRSEKGKELFLELIPKVDVVIESYRAGVMNKIGIGYEKAKSINPGIIYVSLTGYGQTGTFKNKAGHDANYMGYSGLQSLTGNTEGGPHLSGAQFADIAGGAYPAIIGCLSALLSRNSTGMGQHVDVAMTDCLMPLMSMPLAEHLNTPRNIGMGEYMLGGGLAHYNIYKCKDNRYVALGSLEPKFWMGFCAMVGRPEWSSRMIPVEDEIKVLKEDLKGVFAERTLNEWMELSVNHDICLSPILSLEEASEHVYHRERNNFIDVPIDDSHKIRAVNQPIKFSNASYKTPSPPPHQVGIHSEQVLKNFDFSQDQILKFKEWGVIQ